MRVRTFWINFRRRFLKKGRPEFLRAMLLRREDSKLARAPFYRLYSYGGNMSLRDVDLRCVVDTKCAVFYHRIPKNANSSLVTSVTQLTEGRALSADIDDKRRVKTASVLPSTLTAGEAREVERYFKFFVARNPYDRTLSAYLSKVVKKAEAGKPTKTGGRSSDAIPSFGEFCRFLAEGGLYRDHHWSPQKDYLIFPVERYDFIARFETIDRDFATIARRLGHDDARFGMVSEDPRHRTGASARRSEFYTRELYDLVYEIYRSDFDIFGYERSAPAG